MPSSFTWLDASEVDRRRALDVIDLFSVRDTRDQLGLAGIRDAWADRLAPGTSTVQTRARYFLFVPWMYRALAASSVRADRVEARAKRFELGLIKAIRASDPSDGLIGAQAGRGLQRLPSDIYWGGLGAWKVRLFIGARTRYHRALGQERVDSVFLTDGGVAADWNPHLPAPPDDFPDVATLDLRRIDAEFLREQIVQHARGSWIAHLVMSNEVWDTVPALWDHPATSSAPAALARDIEHVRLFSLSMHGAALVYGRMLSEQLGRADWIVDWGKRFDAWVERTRASADSLQHWDTDDFWNRTRLLNPRIPRNSRQFASRWIDGLRVRLRAGLLADLADDAEVRRDITARERFLKRHRARLTHREHLQRWSGASGADAFDFRWPVTQRLVRDIQLGLRRDD